MRCKADVQQKLNNHNRQQSVSQGAKWAEVKESQSSEELAEM